MAISCSPRNLEAKGRKETFSTRVKRTILTLVSRTFLKLGSRNGNRRETQGTKRRLKARATNKETSHSSLSLSLFLSGVKEKSRFTFILCLDYCRSCCTRVLALPSRTFPIVFPICLTPSFMQIRNLSFRFVFSFLRLSLPTTFFALSFSSRAQPAEGSIDLFS